MRIRWTPAAAVDLQLHQRLPQRAPSALPAGNHPQSVCRYPVAERVATPWPCRTRGGNPRALVPAPTLYRCLSREGGEHRSPAYLSRRSGSRLNLCRPRLYNEPGPVRVNDWAVLKMKIRRLKSKSPHPFDYAQGRLSRKRREKWGTPEFFRSAKYIFTWVGDVTTAE